MQPQAPVRGRKSVALPGLGYSWRTNTRGSRPWLGTIVPTGLGIIRASVTLIQQPCSRVTAYTTSIRTLRQNRVHSLRQKRGTNRTRMANSSSRPKAISRDMSSLLGAENQA